MNPNRSFCNFCTIIFLLLGFSSISLNAQKRIGVYAMNIKQYTKTNFLGNKTTNQGLNYTTVPEKIIHYFSNDPDFIVVDKKNKHLISDEMELQKSESFIDGYVVEQGKAEGIDLMCTSMYDVQSKEVSIVIRDVASGDILCTKAKTISSNWLSNSMNHDITLLLQSISTDCFDKKFSVVRITDESKGKAKKLLILGGHAQRIKLGYSMDVIELVEENVNGKKIVRKSKIGFGFVSAIEDENFSILKIKDGKKEVFKAIKAGKQLECKLSR